jgi:serine phosphatase RsbU (regulator of sigma subunit)
MPTRPIPSRSATAPTLRLDPVGGPVGRALPGPIRVPATGPATIGRHPECDVRLDDDAVSKRHATVSPRESGWAIVDLGSRNGTTIDGVRLEANRVSPLDEFDLLRIGPYSFRVGYGESRTAGVSTLDDMALAGRTIERLTAGPSHSPVQRRLDLLVECAGRLVAASDEEQVRKVVLDIMLNGSGYARAVWLTPPGSDGTTRVLLARPDEAGGGSRLEFSRTLITRAARGETVGIVGGGAGDGGSAWKQGASMERLQIHSALCAPVCVNSDVVGLVYLDARGAEDRVQSEVTAFCDGVARLAGLCLANLKSAALDKRRMSIERELEAARAAQRALLPREQGLLARVRYAMRVIPGAFVAGDLLELKDLGDGLVGVAVGDVMGHGVGPGLMMARAQAALSLGLSRLRDPVACVTEVNRFLASSNLMGTFVTAWVGIVDTVGGEVRFVDAGHGHALVRGAGGACRVIRDDGGPPLGMDVDAEYPGASLRIGPGERLVLYSDGIVEQRGPGGEFFGTDRLASALGPAQTERDDVDNAFRALETFAGRTTWDDDATLASFTLE